MPRPVSPADAVEAVRELAARHPAETVWIGIDGPGGAGKSTLADRIAANIDRAVVVAVDDFAGPRVQEWDWARFRRDVVEPVLAGRAGRYRRWDWDADAPAEWHEVPTGSLIVVEGVSATRAEAAVPWTLQIWVQTPRETRLARALERDGPAMMARWLEHWIPSEESYIARERPQERVDLIVPGS